MTDERLRSTAEAAAAYFTFLREAHQWNPTEQWIWHHPKEAKEKSEALIARRDALFADLRAKAEALSQAHHATPQAGEEPQR